MNKIKKRDKVRKRSGREYEVVRKGKKKKWG